MLMTTITIMVNRKASPMQMRRGSAITVVATPFYDRLGGVGRIKESSHGQITPGANSLKKTESTNPVTRPAMAAAPVVLFQNNTQDKHSKYTRADKACILLDEGETSFAADAQYVFPGKDDGNEHGEYDGQASCPDHFLLIGFFIEILFIDIQGKDRGDAVHLSCEGRTMAAVKAAIDRPFRPEGRNPRTAE